VSDGQETVYIGQLTDKPGATRASIEFRCGGKRHNGSNCGKAHKGGTHSLGPEWGTASQYTDKAESKFR